MFEDRTDAGERLGRALSKYRGKGALVLAIPRGGAEVGYRVALHLQAEFSLVIVRKLPLPDNPEAGFGAVAEDGSLFLFREYLHYIPRSLARAVIEEQKREVRRRVLALRGGRPLPVIEGRSVILVDDGLAMGSTMRAAVALCRKAGAEKVVVAVPVAGETTARDFTAIADEVVVLETPPGFRAVADAYRRWYDVPDEEVLAIMDRGERGRTGTRGPGT